MSALLMLIDLQEDYLSAPALFPARGEIEENVQRLLAGCRQARIPIVHVWTTVHAEPDDRMPHWRRQNRRWCVEGTAGHAAPLRLRPIAGEYVVHKTFFSPFQDEKLLPLLRSLDRDTLWIAGIHTHGCIRGAVLDAYQRGFRCLVAADAIGSDDPLHAAITRRYLELRAAEFTAVDRLLESVAARPRAVNASLRNDHGILPAALGKSVVNASANLALLAHYAPADQGRSLWRVPVGGAEETAAAVAAARGEQLVWAVQREKVRTQVLRALGAKVRHHSEALARQMADEIGKPVTQGRLEVARAVEFIEEALTNASRVPAEAACRDGRVRRCPVGVVAMVTPWNNPLAIPLGKLAPALAHGNGVVWKPAPAGANVALRVMQLLAEAGCPAGLVSLLNGDSTTARELMAHGAVDAVTLSGSLAAGYAAQELCARRHLPLQAELGGNNAAIVCGDADIAAAAQAVAVAAFGFAGQRCTANRRVIVDDAVYDAFLDALKKAAVALAWGDPGDDATAIGPVISMAAHSRIAGFTGRAENAGHRVWRPLGMQPHDSGCSAGAYSPPTIVCCDDAAHEIVQEETFGPVLVVQRAAGWDEAVELCNGVRQGLAAALFSRDKTRWEDFQERVHAGVLKRNAATADVSAQLPFGGWGASGVGPSEHGSGDAEFYSRRQAVYGG